MTEKTSTVTECGGTWAPIGATLFNICGCDQCDPPRKRVRGEAPWRIWPVNREWRIEKRITDGYETWCRFDTSTEAFAAFAAGGAR
ncbi:hypothetical protein R2362_20190 [Mycobacteroides chelonae]|nr:hypothetical protein [Mycobacteroides chelonae]